MTYGHIVLVPQKFSAEEYEDQIKEIILNRTRSDTGDMGYMTYRKEILGLINKFAKNGIRFESETDYEAPWNINEIIIELFEELDCIITKIDIDGDGFILNLREYSEKIEELL